MFSKTQATKLIWLLSMFYLCVIYASSMFSFGPQTTVEIWFEDPVSDKDYHHLGPQTGPLLKYQQQWGCSLAFKCLVSRGEKSRKRFRPYTWPRATEHFQSQNWSWKFINLATSLSKSATSSMLASALWCQPPSKMHHSLNEHPKLQFLGCKDFVKPWSTLPELLFASEFGADT